MNGYSIAVRGENLIKDYGDVRAVDGLDLDVREGEILGFLGGGPCLHPYGAGFTLFED